MAVTSGFFNSINHDRLYDAEQLSSIFDGIVLDGVYESIGTAFMVSAINDEMAVKIGTGRAWFDHIWVLNDSEFIVNLDPANVALPRIDAIVLDIDKRTNNRTGSIKYIRGDYSSIPVRPSLVKEDNVHVQYPIAYIEVASGSNVTIDQTKITRTVGTSECPYVIGVLTVINADTYWKQLETEFNIWWDGVKDTISSENLLDIELRLQNVENKTNEIDKNIVLAPDYVYEQETLVTYDMYETWVEYVAPIMDFILPDKKFITLFDYNEGFYCSKVYDLDDIKKSNNNEYAGEIVNIRVGAKKIASIPNYAYQNYWFSKNVSVIKSETETYPANIYVYYFRPVYSNTDQYSYVIKNAYADIIKITVSSDHVISYSTVSSVKTPLNNTYKGSDYNEYHRKAYTTKFPLRVFGNDYTFITFTLQKYSSSSYDYQLRLMFQNVSYNKDTLVLDINKESSIDRMFDDSQLKGVLSNVLSLIGYGRSDNSGYVLMFSHLLNNQGGGEFTANSIITGDSSFENVEWVKYDRSIDIENFSNTYFSNIRFCSDIEVTVYKGRHKYVYTDSLIPSKSLCESTLSGGTPKFIKDRQLGWGFTVYPMIKISDDTSIGFESMIPYPFSSNFSDRDKRRITLYNVYNTSTDADRVSKYKNSTMVQCLISDGEDHKVLGSEYFVIYALSCNHFPVRAFDDSIIISPYSIIELKLLESFKQESGSSKVGEIVQPLACSEPIVLTKKRS